MGYERMARLPEVGPHTEPSATVPVWITETDLQGLTALVHWLDGFESAKPGQIPGAHELVMFVRRMNSAVWDSLKKKDEIQP